MSSHLQQIMPSDMYQEKIRIISVYAYDIYKALWYGEVCKMNKKYILNLFI